MAEEKKPEAAAAAPSVPPTETITLAEPIRRGDQTIDSLQVRKPRAGELRGLDLQDLLTGDVNAMLVVIPRIVTPLLTTEEAERLDISDLALLAGALRGFFMTADERAAVQRFLGVIEREETSTS